MRTHAIFRTFALVPALVFLPACDSGTGAYPAPQRGLYALQRVDGRPLPTTVPCTGTQVLERHIVLGSDREAFYSSREVERGTGGKEVTFQARGRFRQEDERVVLTLRGGYTHETAEYDFRIAVLAEPTTLTQLRVGTECDGNSTLRFELIQAQ